MGKNIIITEEQLKKYISYILEGSYHNVGSDGNSIDFGFNNSRTNADNRFIDTRFFRNASDMLYTKNKRGDNLPSNLVKSVERSTYNINIAEIAIEYLNDNENNPNILIDIQKDLSPQIPQEFINTLIDNINKGGINSALECCIKKIRDNKSTIMMSKNLALRAQTAYINAENEDTPNDKMAQYGFGIVPETNIRIISLFSMQNFNPSDTLKNGNMRYDDDTTKILGFDKNAENIVNGYAERDWDNVYNRDLNNKKKKISQQSSLFEGWSQLNGNEQDNLRKKEISRLINKQIPKVQTPFSAGKEWGKINVTYNGGKTPNIADNFSLNNDYQNDKTDHFRNDKNYNSVSNFIDKSILCANYALKEVNYIPDFIVSAPSSSKFNDYYCTRLSRKLGIPYIRDFFVRNLINLKYDSITEKRLDLAGATVDDKVKIDAAILKAVNGEITSQMLKIVKNFVENNFNILSQISSEKYSRIKVNIPFLIKCIVCAIYNDIILYKDKLPKTNTYYHLAKQLIKVEINYSSLKNDNANYLIQEFAKKIKTAISLRTYAELLEQIDNILNNNSEKFANGFTINLKKFKIVDIDARFRKCLNQVYIISDKVLDRYGNKLQKQYQNGNFLIFDEDIDTGATLKYVIEILQDKIGTEDNKIMCLTNGYKRGYNYEND